METKKICQNCHSSFEIDNDDLDFYKKVNVPPPTFCWLCRAQRRFAWRNERSLFKRVSDYSEKDIFSAFSPEAPVKVYEKEVWNSDEWDPLEHGREYDLSKPFFEQFKELLRAVPLKNLNVVNGVNSDYVNNFTDPKNCYLVFNGNGGEDCMYGNGISHSKYCVDCSHIAKSERCYEGFWLTQCTNVKFSSMCEASYDISFCRDCVGCHDCFGCVGLRKKHYCFFNEQLSKKEYEKRLSDIDLSSRAVIEEMRRKAHSLWLTFPRKYIEGFQNTGVSGNYVEHSKNVRQSFLVRECENMRYCQYVQELPGSRDCWDYTAWGDGNELVYECCGCGIGTHNIRFCYNVQENSRDIEYSFMCAGSSDLFGCIGLKKKSYCILNKQYSKESFDKLRIKIVEQMDEVPYIDARGRIYKYGEFFPSEFSPFAYNESIAQEYFPLKKEDAERSGFVWRDPAERSYSSTVKASELPDSVKEASDSILKETIACLHEGDCNHQCKTAFKITPDELQFYRANNLPIPQLCASCRHFERIQERSLLQTYQRMCQCMGEISENGAHHNAVSHAHGNAPCETTFETTYPPKDPCIVYCEECYQKEVA